ncbi:MAG: plasmid pRiA4b ORF-3 family protein [Pseudonocardiales bacterium]|nr:plasmid pRiA4b ORF-3 family protein [Pseudonocardiales bacterium]MBV9029077.1 plasmid pRiA4b ORF-3 family protein [Pseudonocardiales bacterium]
MTSSAPVTAAEPVLVRQVVEFVRWVGDGRRLTQKGAVTLADARVVVERLGTGDELDPAIGERVFKTRSSVELLGLSLIVEWAKAARLVRVVRGRLVPVKKAAALLDRPAELWTALFEVFGRLGPAFLPSGWGESFLRSEFAAGFDALLSVLYGRDGAVGLDELCDLAWHTVTAPYVLDDATDIQLTTTRRMNDRDVRRTLSTLARLGAVTLTEDAAELTATGRRGTRRMRGEPEPGDPVHQITVTLAEVTDPPVWRRLLIPATMSLSRLHEVIQTAMGWQNCHLHSFTDGNRTYGLPDPELEFTDERSVRLGDLDLNRGAIRYSYDFGDDWEHEILIEALGAAEPGESYPRCIGGGGACPPEDCGGPPGYAQLREVLADPGDEEHDDMVRWLGLEHACEFDPAAFDIELVNRELRAGR